MTWEPNDEMCRATLTRMGVEPTEGLVERVKAQARGISAQLMLSTEILTNSDGSRVRNRRERDRILEAAHRIHAGKEEEVG